MSTHHNCNRTNFPSNNIVVIFGTANAKNIINLFSKPIYSSKNVTKCDKSWQLPESYIPLQIILITAEFN